MSVWPTVRRVDVGLATATLVPAMDAPRRAVIRLVAGPGNIGLAHDSNDTDVVAAQGALSSALYLLPLSASDTFILAPGQAIYGVSIGAVGVVSVEIGPWDPDVAWVV